MVKFGMNGDRWWHLEEFEGLLDHENLSPDFFHLSSVFSHWRPFKESLSCMYHDRKDTNSLF